MLPLSFPIDSPINIVMEQKVMKMNACWFGKWMMSTAARIQTCIWMGLVDHGCCPHPREVACPQDQPGLAMCGPGPRTPHRAGTNGHTWIGEEKAQEWNKGTVPERILGTQHHPALHRVNYSPLFTYRSFSPCLSLQSVVGSLER